MPSNTTSATASPATDVEYDVFLSHNSADKPAVRHIKELLNKRRIRCWFDESDLRGGADWTTRLEDGLRRSRCCAIFYGPSGIGPWHEMERQLAQLMAVEAWREGQHFGIIPVRLPDAPEWRKLALPPFLRLYTSVEFPSLSDDAALNRLTAGILQEAPPPEMPGSDRAPYIGMRPFTEADSAIFTGRNNYIIHIAEQVHRAELPRFLAVLGASGSGKSSLLHAGVLPWLRQGTLHPETKDWTYVPMRPGSNALSNLDAALRGVPALRPHLPPVGATPEQRRAQWSGNLLHEVAATALGTSHGASRLVLIVDQFEELFTFRPSGQSAAEEKRRNDYMTAVWEPFLRNLAGAVREPSGPVSVIVSMRADFLAHFAEDESLAPFLSDFRLRCLIQPLSEREVRAAIERPAVSRGLTFDAALVETVVQDYQLDPAGALPFLQEALLRVWEKGGHKELSLAHYREFGGLRGAVNAHADHVLRAFAAQSPEKAALIPTLFIYLTRLADDGGPDTKRRRPLSELPGGEPAQALALELATAEHRLLVLDDASGQSATNATEPAAAPGDETPRKGATVEIAHESLLVGWKELRTWLSQKRPERIRLRHLESEARAWQEEGGDPGALLRGPDVRRAERLCRSFRDETPAMVTRFVGASRSALNRRILRNGAIATAAVAAIIFIAPMILSWFGWRTDHAEELRRLHREMDAIFSQPGFDAPAVAKVTREILQLDPGDAEAWPLLASALLEQDRYAEFDAAIAAWKQNAPAGAAKVDELLGDKAARQNQWALAVGHWNAYEKQPALDEQARIVAWQKLARAHGKLRQWIEAEQWLTKWILAGDNLKARIARVEAGRMLGKWEQAWEDLNYARAVAPSDPEVKKILPLPPLEVLKALNEKLSHAREDPALYLQRAQVLARARAFAAAREDVETARNLDPNSTRLAIEHAHLCWQLDEPIPEELGVRAAKEWTRDDAAFSSAFERLQKNHDALARLDDAVRAAPDRAAPRMARGAALAQLGQHELAIRDFSQACEFEPARAEAWTQRAASYRALGKTDLAEADLQRARELGGENPRNP